MAVLEGVDSSYDPPTVAELQAAGKRFSIRYVSTPGHAKNLKLAEAQALKAAGLGIAVVGEITAGRALGGFSQGKADMTTWQAQAWDLGAPRQVPIYMAVDIDIVTAAAAEGRAVTLAHRELRSRMADLPEPAHQGDPNALAALGPEGAKVAGLRSQLRAAQMPTVVAYIQGGASVNGHRWTGVYGEYDVIMACQGASACYYFWPTYAWSGGRWPAHSHLQQYKNNVALGSATVDLTRAMVPDYGQWWGQQPAGWWTRPLSQADLDAIGASFVRALQ